MSLMRQEARRAMAEAREEPMTRDQTVAEMMVTTSEHPVDDIASVRLRGVRAFETERRLPRATAHRIARDAREYIATALGAARAEGRRDGLEAAARIAGSAAEGAGAERCAAALEIEASIRATRP